MACARLDGRAGISADGYRLFVYTETEALAGQAAQAALQLAGESGLAPQVTLDWWNADAAEWRSGDDGPRPDQERAVGQHERQVAADARRSAATGVPQWTVRVTLPSRDDAVRLAGWLQSAGIPAARRKSVLLGAADEDVARELERLTAEQAPEAHV